MHFIFGRDYMLFNEKSSIYLELNESPLNLQYKFINIANYEWIIISSILVNLNVPSEKIVFIGGVPTCAPNYIRSILVINVYGP